MTSENEFAATLIETGSSGYAGLAAARLLERHPEWAERYGTGALTMWKQHLGLRLRELSASLLSEEPSVFLAQVEWSRLGFAARQAPIDDLRTSLDCLREVLEEELPESARPGVRELLDRSLEALGSEAADLGEGLDPLGPRGRLAIAFVEAAASGDRERAVAVILDAVGDGLPTDEAFETLTVAQREIGRLWHTGELEIAQEHAATTLVGELVTLLAERQSRKPGNGKTVVVAVVEGNAHDLGAKMLAARLDREGWRTIALGGELPARDTAQAVAVYDADLLALSVALPTHLRPAMAAAHAARAARPELKILAGGRAIVGQPELAKRLGADAGAADLDEAVEVAARLAGLG